MTTNGAVVVVGGTRAIGLELAKHYALLGHEVVITGQDEGRVAAAVEAVSALGGGGATGVAFDLAKPETIGPALAGVGPVRRLALVAIDRDHNTTREYDIARAIRLVTLKLVGFTETVHVLIDRLTPDASVLLFGGMAKERPYPGSTTVTTVNGGIVALTRSLVEELKPIRVNSIHPGVVGDSPYWRDNADAIARLSAATPVGRLATMTEIVDAAAFLLENGAANGIELIVDGGWHTR